MGKNKTEEDEPHLTKLIMVRLDEATNEKLRLLAKTAKRKPSAMIRLLIQSAVAGL